MKRECPQCGFELREMTWSEKFTQEKLERFRIDDTYGEGSHGFDIWMDAKIGDTWHVPDLGEVRLVESHTSYDFEYSENMVYVVLSVEDHSFYRKEGSRDSHGGSDWSGDFRAVVKQTREVWIWEENA